jgi:CO/xanthine dehydrogenase FAD-binding subunit
VLTVDHRFALSKPALVSAPSKKTFSSAAEAEMPRGAKALAARLLDGAKPSKENAFKLTLTERTLGAVLSEAKG